MLVNPKPDVYNNLQILKRFEINNDAQAYLLILETQDFHFLAIFLPEFDSRGLI